MNSSFGIHKSYKRIYNASMNDSAKTSNTDQIASNNPGQTSLDHQAQLVFPQQLINQSGFDEFGFVVLVSHRSNQLSKGAEPTISVPHNEKEPITAMLEVAAETISLSDMHQQYMTNSDDNIINTEYYSGLGNEEDQYALNLAPKTDSMSEEFMGLSALFNNPND